MINVVDLRFTYPKGSQETLKGISFQFGKGEVFGFLGPSGAGKSTTQKILYKLLDGYSGQVLVHGKPLKQMGSDYFQRIGVGFELPNHYPKLTARENLQLFGQFYDRKQLLDPNVLLEKVGLLQDADKRVEEYSKGMKMRLNFVRAIQHNPDILFFDEPTSGMDPGNAALIKELILEQKQQGKAIFITTHNMFAADQLCDQVAFMLDGAILAMDSPRNFKQQHGSDRVELELQDGAVRPTFPLQGIGQNAAFLSLIAETQIKAIHTQEATLEEVFLKLTGNRLSQ
ncbi:MAG: ABC transporter ATP-binding protein [Bacteroidia bacterium]